jgi:hypothetical protein
MKFRYHSFDFDGCLNNEAFVESLGKRKQSNAKGLAQLPPELVDEAIIEANQALFETITLDEDTQDVVMVGSNRQNLLIDWANGQSKNGSVLPRLQAIAKHLKASFDKFLLADIVSGKQFGSESDLITRSKLQNPNGSYNGANESELIANPENTFLVDEASKVGLLLAQMQKASMDHPNDEIEFNFYEDREDILNGVKGFFEKHPELVPKNIVLNINGYSGPKLTGQEAERRDPTTFKYGLPEQIAVIKGQGRIPRDAMEWVPFYKDITGLLIAEKMQSQMAIKPQDIMGHINLAKDFDVQKLLDKYKKDGISFEKMPKLAQDLILKPLVEQLIQGERVADNNDHINQFFKLSPEMQEAVQRRLHEMEHESSKPLLEKIHLEGRFRLILDKLDKLQKAPNSVNPQHQKGMIEELQRWPDRIDLIRHRYEHPNERVTDIVEAVSANLFIARYDAIKDKQGHLKEFQELVMDYFKLSDGEQNQVKVRIQSPEYQQLHEEIHNRDFALAFIKNLDTWNENPDLLNQQKNISRYKHMAEHVSRHPKIESMMKEHYSDKFPGQAKAFFEEVDKLKWQHTHPSNSVQQAKVVIGLRKKEEQQQDTNTNNYASKTNH